MSVSNRQLMTVREVIWRYNRLYIPMHGLWKKRTSFFDFFGKYFRGT